MSKYARQNWAAEPLHTIHTRICLYVLLFLHMFSLSVNSKWLRAMQGARISERQTEKCHEIFTNANIHFGRLPYGVYIYIYVHTYILVYTFSCHKMWKGDGRATTDYCTMTKEKLKKKIKKKKESNMNNIQINVVVVNCVVVLLLSLTLHSLEIFVQMSLLTLLIFGHVDMSMYKGKLCIP